MKKIIIARCGNGYNGCDAEEAFIYDADVSEAEIEEDVRCFAIENAESFSHVHFGWDNEEVTEEEYDEYIQEYVEYEWRCATREEYLEFCENWGIKPEEDIYED